MFKIFRNLSFNYSTAGGPYQTSSSTPVTFKLPEFSISKEITWHVDMDSRRLEEFGYDMIIGRDLLQAPQGNH